MRFILALLIITIFSFPNAFAVVDPDPDGIGVYFDLDADMSQTNVQPGPPFFAYVVLTNPSSENLLAYEFSYRVVPTPGMETLLIRLDMVFPEFVPHDLSLPYHEILSDEVSVRTFVSTPMPESPAVVLITWQFLLLGQMEVQFYLGPTSGEYWTPGQLAYKSEVGYVAMNPSSGDPLLPVAMVNSEGVVPVTNTSFGSLKILFR